MSDELTPPKKGWGDTGHLVGKAVGEVVGTLFFEGLLTAPLTKRLNAWRQSIEVACVLSSRSLRLWVSNFSYSSRSHSR